MNEVIKIPKKRKKDAEIRDRIDHIITLLAMGKKRAQIIVDPIVASWGMTNSSIDNYMQKAKGDIVENSRQARSEHLGRAVMNLDYLYQKALDCIEAEPDKRSSYLTIALNVQKEKNKLLQLSQVYDPDNKSPSKELVPDAVNKMLDDITIVNSPTVREKDLDAELGKKLIASNSM